MKKILIEIAQKVLLLLQFWSLAYSFVVLGLHSSSVLCSTRTPRFGSNPKISLRRGLFERSLIILLFITFAVQSSFAAFENSNVGVRAAALGGAFSAMADDATTLFFNPAGTSQLVRGEMVFNYARPFAGLNNVKINQGSLMIAGPTFEDFGIGIGATVFNANNMYQEVQVVTNLAYQWKNLFFVPDTSFAIGGNLRFMTLKLLDLKGAIAEGDEAAKMKSMTKPTIDLGAIFRYNGFRFGVAGQNLMKADFGIVTESTIHRETHIGAGYDFILDGKETLFEDTHFPFRVTPLIELYKRGDQDYQLSVGCEIQPFANLAFQAGISEEKFTIGCSWGRMNVPAPRDNSEELAIPSAFKPRLDIGYEFSRKVQGDMGTPSVSLIWRF